nr:zinc-dependent peptidase [Mesonia aestuariivivens]
MFISLLDHLHLHFFNKPTYIHFYFKLKKLSWQGERFIKDKFIFYNRLTAKQKNFFQHRVVLFMKDKSFEGRGGFEINNQVKLYISSTAVMLTFGMREFLLPALQKIFVYPDIYYSTINQTHHKGEFNPRLKALVFSWKDFLEGFADGKDNLNLAIHEFIHVIQINSMKENDISATIFADSSKNLTKLLLNDKIRQRLEATKYFRAYAFTNRFEFLAVLVEYFIENPLEFKQKFPEFYSRIREMLNYNFGGY